MKGIPDMIKVMNIITDTNIGGAGRLIIQCLKCFDRTKFDIVLVVPSQSALIPLIKNEGYRVIETEKGHRGKKEPYASIKKSYAPKSPILFTLTHPLRESLPRIFAE